MIMPFLFLMVGISAITFMFIPIISTFSLMNGNQNSNNTNQSQLSFTTNFTLLKQLDLFTLTQRLNNTISDLMAVADASMNGSNSFGNLPLVNVTSEMKLKYHGIPSNQDLEKRNEAKKLLATQREDGGWSQLANLESDSYATGQALYALYETGQLQTDDTAFQNGISFLLKTQYEDGSWKVKSRSFPTVPFVYNGFPHEKDQFISAAGTNWATMALLLAVK